MIRKDNNKDKRAKQPLVKFGKRLKKRHYLIEFIFTNEEDESRFHSIQQETIHNSFSDNFIKYWGMMGKTLLYQRPAYRVIYFNNKTHLCMIQIPHSIQDMFSASLPFFKSVNNISCFVRVLHIAGTIRTLKTVAIEYHQRWMREAHIKKVNAPKDYSFAGEFVALDDVDDDLDEVMPDRDYVKNAVDILTAVSTSSEHNEEE